MHDDLTGLGQSLIPTSLIPGIFYLVIFVPILSVALKHKIIVRNPRIYNIATEALLSDNAKSGLMEEQQKNPLGPSLAITTGNSPFAMPLCGRYTHFSSNFKRMFTAFARIAKFSPSFKRIFTVLVRCTYFSSSFKRRSMTLVRCAHLSPSFKRRFMTSVCNAQFSPMFKRKSMALFRSAYFGPMFKCSKINSGWHVSIISLSRASER